MTETGSNHTVDAFHRGRFHLVQPAKGAHRAGMDALVLAAVVPDGFDGRIADFGAGAGAAALAVLTRCPEADTLLIERSFEMAEFARKTLELPENAAFSRNVKVIEADVAGPLETLRAGGIPENSLDFVIMNPPFNEETDRESPNALRAEAHVRSSELFEDWIRRAATLLKPGGKMAAIFRPGSIAEVLRACERRFGAIQIKAIHPKSRKDAVRVVLKAVKGSRAALSISPPLALHDDNVKGFSATADAIINGRAMLFD